MKKIILLFLMFQNYAHADIYSRIDSCESSGGQACIFHLLRELAGAKTGGTVVTRINNCKCEAVKGESVSSPCFMKYEGRLTLNGNRVNVRCSGTKDEAFLDCMALRKKTDVCFE